MATNISLEKSIQEDNESQQDNKTVEAKAFDPSAMEQRMEKICDILFSEEFVETEAEEALNEYLREYERLTYNVISNKVFNCKDDDKMERLTTNVDKLLQYVWEKEKETEQLTVEENVKANKNLFKIVIKIRDHINLAKRQYSVLKYTDNELEAKLDEFSKPIEMRITKEMSVQLITLVGIFTAIAFVVFGGISSLEAIFSNISRNSLLAIVIAGCVWSLCITDLIFIFMFQLERITQKEFFTHHEENVFKRYAIVWWSNLVLVIVLLLSSWTYIALDGKVFKILNQAWFTGAFLIVMVFIFAALWLFEKMK